jgi:hypothetical protein
VEKGTVAELQQEKAIRVISRNHLPAPVMLAPLKEVFPVTSAPSKLAFDKFVCKMKWGKTNHERVEKRITMPEIYGQIVLCFIKSKVREEHEQNGSKYKRLI